MDPTVPTGNMFTHRGGAQNHVVCNMWSSSVKREHAAQRRWASTFGRSVATTHPASASLRLDPDALAASMGEASRDKGGEMRFGNSSMGSPFGTVNPARRRDLPALHASQALLPPELRGQNAVAEDAALRDRGLGIGRKELLALRHTPASPGSTASSLESPPLSARSGTLTSPSGQYGGVGDRAPRVESARLRHLQTELSPHGLGRRPVVASSFFRPKGVM